MRRRISRRSPLRAGPPRARASSARGRMLEQGPRGRYRRGWPENDAHRLRAAPLRGDRHRGPPRGAPRRRHRAPRRRGGGAPVHAARRRRPPRRRPEDRLQGGGPNRPARRRHALARRPGHGDRARPRPAPRGGHPPRVAPNRAHGSGRPHHRNASRLGLRERRRRPIQCGRRVRRAPARGSRRVGARSARPDPRSGRRRRLRDRRRHLRAPLARGAHQRRDRARRAVAASELPRRTRPRGPPAPGDDPRRRGRAGRRGGAGHGQARPDPRGDRAGRAAHAERGGLEAALTRPRAGPLQVNIAILGGTGKEGAGRALRWALAGHSIIIGSRDRERAKAKAAELREITRKMPIMGESNAEAAKLGTVVVLALPAPGLATTLPEVSAACRDKVVISTVVALSFGGPRLYTPPPAGSSAEEAQALLPGAKVVAAFHHIAAHELAETDQPIDCDLLLCGDQAAKDTVAELGRSMGLRPVDVGPLSNAALLEGVTAILATINRRYGLKNAGIKITGL